MTSAEAVARSDAAFDGRDFDHLPRHERERYIKRAEAGIKADSVRAEMLEALRAACGEAELSGNWDKYPFKSWYYRARAAIAKAEAEQ